MTCPLTPKMPPTLSVQALLFTTFIPCLFILFLQYVSPLLIHFTGGLTLMPTPLILPSYTFMKSSSFNLGTLFNHLTVQYLPSLLSPEKVVEKLKSGKNIFQAAPPAKKEGRGGGDNKIISRSFKSL